jgi:hypothetical protein
VNPDCHQRGSNITADRMRFDFNCDHKLTPEEKQATEELVNEWIQQDLVVTHEEMPKQQAVDSGAECMFIEKYPDIVTVYTIGEVSKEICGGPHVEHTGVLGHFKIKKEGYSFPKIENTNNNISTNTNTSSTQSNPNVQLKRNDTELEIALNEILDKNKENEEDKKLDINVFWTIFKTMILSEFFDRTQISTLSMSSIFNFSGVLIGSSIALTITCYLGAYQGKNMIKILKEKVLSFILGCIFIAYAIQVYIGKQRDSTQTTAPVV